MGTCGYLWKGGRKESRSDKSNVIQSRIQGENCKWNKGDEEKNIFLVFTFYMGGNNNHRPLDHE